MLSILNKLGTEYFVFVSIFHSKRTSIPNWKMPTLDSFVKSLIHEQEKLVQMGVIQTSRDQALLVTSSTKAQAKGRPKGKGKNFEKKKCPYCMRGFRPKYSCMKKTLDQLKALCVQTDISLPQGADMFDDVD